MTLPTKALIKVGYACNEHCSFCHTQDLRDVQGASAEIEAKIDRAAALGHEMVVLSGGEATIRPELFTWAARIAGHGMDLGLVTNGLVLAYPDVLDRLCALRLRYVYMSLHGGDAKIHDGLVRARSFDTAVAALANLQGRGLDLTINCVVTHNNLAHLRALVDRVLTVHDAKVKFSCVEPKGGATHLYDPLVPRVSEAAAAVADAIGYGRRRAGAQGPRFVHGGFPLCLLPGLHDAFDDLRTHGFRTMIEVGEPDFFPVDDANKIHPPACTDCRLRGACPGLFVGYHARHGDAELRPHGDGPRANAFDWVFAARVPTPDDGACPLLRDGTTPWDKGRDLFVRHGGRIARYHAATRDFNDAEITHIKHARGQIYLDASQKPAPDDFARDLVPLRRSAACTGCPVYEGCTGMFEPVFQDWFSRDDAIVRDRVATLRGDVLDVGCGEGPYDDVLGDLVARSQVRYVGLEPDADRAARVQARRGWGRVLAESIETHTARAAYDHVLVLRSWNHLHDPDGALDRIVAALRPGGTLTIVDNVAFGLARTPAQTARARASSAAWEHRRNDDATAADRRIAARGLVLEHRHDVTPDTCNQWLLSYRRA